MTTAAYGRASHTVVLGFSSPSKPPGRRHPAGVAPIAAILASMVATALCVA